MKVCGIICEYNPLHQGHAYQMDKARSLSGCDYVVCLMSGSFTQRGEPAVFDKWLRTRWALMAGADLVIELPTAYALSSAQGFAEGGIGIFQGLGVITHLSFGTEIADLEALDILAGILLDEPEAYKAALQDQLGRGVSFPSARASAVNEYLHQASLPLHLKSTMHRAVSLPNCILGMEYIRALKRRQSHIIPVPVERVGSGHGDESLSPDFSSATAIRKSLSGRGCFPDLGAQVPAYVASDIPEAARSGRGPVFMSDLDALVLYALRGMTPEQVSELPDAGEGLGNRIHEAARRASSVEELLGSVKCKRYTLTRLQRICMYALLKLNAADMHCFSDVRAAGFIRILGLKKRALPLLKHVKHHSCLPVISKAADAASVLDPLQSRLFHYDLAASDIHSLAMRGAAFRKSGKDFTEKIVILP